VTGERGAYLAGKMAKAAQQWWQSVIDSPHSFQKPTYYLGLGNWTVTNMLAAGAHERTPEKIQLIINGATGFYNAGDSMCFKLKVGKCVLCCSSAVHVRWHSLYAVLHHANHLAAKGLQNTKQGTACGAKLLAVRFARLVRSLGLTSYYCCHWC
jgi:hypothetical protein